LNSGKNVTFVLPPKNDFWGVLDTLKLCDVALFLMPVLQEMSPEAKVLLKCAKDQGLPTPFMAVSENFTKALLTDSLFLLFRCCYASFC